MNLLGKLVWNCGLPCLVIALAFASGCSKPESIRIYTVSKKDKEPRAVTQNSTSAGTEQQMLGAIVPSGSNAWFFKLMGDPEKITKHRDDFRGMIDTIEFEQSGGPALQLADGWEQKILSGGVTYARLTNNEEGLAATVTVLLAPSMQDEAGWQKYVVDNINRWRGQLSLEPQDWASLEPELEEVQDLSQGPAKAYFVSLVGKGAGGGMSAAPFAGGAGMGASDMRASPPPSSGASSGNADAKAPESGKAPSSDGLEYEAPESWTALDVSNSSMRKAAFAIGTEDEVAEVTVIAAGGDIEANLGIWLGQVGVEREDQLVQQIQEAAESVEVSGTDSKVYFIEGAEQSVAVADIPWTDGGSLFVKLKGDKALVSQTKDDFMNFLKSLSWQTP